MGPRKKVNERKKKRKTISIQQKQEIIAKHFEGMSVMQLARMYETGHSTISTILSKKEEIMAAKVAKGTSRLNIREHILEEMENLLLIWINETETEDEPIPQSAIRQKAREIYQDLKTKTPGTSNGVDGDDFKGSRGWYDNFRKRTGIHSGAKHGEADNTEAAVNDFTRIMEEGDYLSQKVYSCDETELFWKKMSNGTFVPKEEKILPTVDDADKKTSWLNVRGHLMEDMENLLLIWIKEIEMAGDTVSQNAICQKARQIYHDLKMKTVGSGYEVDGHDFKGSRGWFDNFEKRTGIHNVIRHGEANNGDKAAADEFVNDFRRIIEEGEYLPQQVFNCDETWLFWKKMPKGTFVSKKQKTLVGHEPIDDRLTLLLAVNASGDCKIKPMLVYHSENPRAFKKFNVSKSSLGVLWKSNCKAWVTRLEFRDWIREVFGPTVKAYLEQNNLPIKAILTLYNAPGHPTGKQEKLTEQFDFIKVIFLPPKTTSLIQPMDQHIIANFKKLYTKALFTRCFEMCEATNMTPRKFWEEEFNIVIAIMLIVKAWQEVSIKCVKTAWRKLCPSFSNEECSSPEQTSDEGHELVKDIVETARDLNLEVEEEDVEELLEEHDRELTTDELKELFKQYEENEMEISSEDEDIEKEQITTAEIKNVLAKWEEVQNIAMKWNPDKSEVIRTADLFNEKSMQFFRDVLKKRQTTLDIQFLA